MAEFRIESPELRTLVANLDEARKTGDTAKAENVEKKVLEKTDKIAEKKKDEAKDRLRFANRVLSAAGCLILIGSIAYAQPWNNDLDEVRRAAGIGIPLAVLLAAFLGALQWGQGGLLAYVRGKDKRLSTSLTPVALWTIALATAFLYFICLDVLSKEEAHSLASNLGTAWGDFPEEYLLLLGGPFAAAVITRMSVGTKVDDGRLQKVEANETKLRDVVTDDNGNGSLVDSQFLVFNLVALTWFAVALIGDQTSLPVIPPVLAGLTGVAALGYTASKAAEANQPRIRSVTRHLGAGVGGVRAGDLVDVHGANFVPPGAASEEFIAQMAVRFGTTDVLPEIELDDQKQVVSPTNSSMVSRVPETLEAGAVKVSVITAAGAQSDSYDLSIVANKAIVTGLDPSVPRRGKPLTVKGRFFVSPRATEGMKPTVMFDDIPVEADEATDERLTVARVHAGRRADSVRLRVIAAGGVEPSDEIKLRLR